MIKPFWGWAFKDGSIRDGRYVRGWTYEEALAEARRRWGEEVDPASLHRWHGIL